MLKLLFRPPVIALALLGLAFAGHQLLEPPRLVPWAAWPVGVVFVLTGLAVALVALRTFAKAGTSKDPYAEPAVLVTHGIFARTRNPMYASLTGALLGIALLVGTWPFFAVPVLFLGVIATKFVPMEERRLRRHFGDDYEAYCRRVPRWLF